MSSERRRWEGWKQIAERLEKDVTTVTRWEQERGLPIRRLPGKGRRSVFVYEDELVAWLDSAQPENNEVTPTVVGDETTSPRVKSLQRYRYAIAGFILMTLAILALARSYSLPGHLRVARAELSNAGLTIRNAAGKVLWTVTYERPPEFLPNEEWRTWVGELNPKEPGPEILAAVRFVPDGNQKLRRNVLHCYSADGRLLWRYEPDVALTFGGRGFEGPWAISSFVVDRNTESLWISFIHHTWWPSFVVRVDPFGKGSLVFAHPGWILSLLPLGNRSPLVLAAGVNNEHGSPAVAVLDSRADGAVSPPAGKDLRFICSSCEKRQPLRYVVFPRSELNTLIGGRYDKDVGFRTQSEEVLFWNLEVPGAGVVSSLSISANMKPVSFQFDDEYWLIHDRLQLEGKIGHSSKDCPERRGRAVQVWAPSEGWNTVTLRETF